MQGAVEQGILAMQNRPFQGPFCDVIVQRGRGLPEEQRQGLPVPQQIRDCVAQPGVRLRLVLG